MDFYFYPADTQRCHLDIKSYAYSTKHVTISWKGGKGPELAYPIDIHNFDVALDTEPDYTQDTRSASYSAIRFTLYLRRKLSYHIFQTFIPSALFTIVSWLSFLVPPESTPGRMAICVTTLLTLSAMFSSVRQNMPSTSYLKALDLWMLTCVVFVFTVIIEYTAVLKLRSMTVKEKKEPVVVLVPSSGTKSDSGGVIMDVRARSVSTEPSPQLVTKRSNFSALDFSNNGDGNPATVPLLMSRPMTPASPLPPSDSGGEKKKPTKYFILACKFEKYTPRIMPLLFLAFNLAYWPGLLISSDYYQLRGDKEMYYSLWKTKYLKIPELLEIILQLLIAITCVHVCTSLTGALYFYVIIYKLILRVHKILKHTHIITILPIILPISFRTIHSAINTKYFQG